MNNNKPADIFTYLDYRSFLADFFAAKKKDNFHFSVRMVAYRLGCNPGFFTRVLKGTRNLSPHYILKLTDVLKLNTKQKKYFELLVNYNQAKKQIEKDHYFRQLDIFRSSKVKTTALAQHAMYAEWFYVVLRELINIIPCKNFSEATCRLIAKHFDPRVRPDQIRQALAILDDVGMLKRSGNGTFTVRERFITTGMDIPQVIINRVLIQFIDLARFAVDRFPRQERSLSTLTFSVSERGFEKIREKLDQYRREILSIVNEERDTIDRVYHLNMHLFPVTRAYQGCAQ
jgi:uncharacterized protein (TIGR02147 family)